MQVRVCERYVGLQKTCLGGVETEGHTNTNRSRKETLTKTSNQNLERVLVSPYHLPFRRFQIFSVLQTKGERSPVEEEYLVTLPFHVPRKRRERTAEEDLVFVFQGTRYTAVSRCCLRVPSPITYSAPIKT